MAPMSTMPSSDVIPHKHDNIEKDTLASLYSLCLRACLHIYQFVGYECMGEVRTAEDKLKHGLWVRDLVTVLPWQML